MSKNVSPSETRSRWSAVFAMSLAAFALVASEFMPVSLLTPIASDLHISEGRAGQAIAISGAFALIASLSITKLAGRMDRKIVLLGLTLLMMISGTVVALAPNYEVFMLGRALIGVAIGGFWSMSAATMMRLVQHAHIPRALAILNGGNALASVLAAPLGSFLGALVGWRWAFFCVVPVAALAAGWKFSALPALKHTPMSNTGNVLKPLLQTRVILGMSAAALLFMGQFTLFTYLRPFLESVTHIDTMTLSLVLLGIGVSGFIGTMLIGSPLARGLYRTMSIIPLMMAAIALLLIVCGHSLATSTLLLLIWGLTATAAPVGWWTWLARVLPNDAEAGGGWLVAIVQLAIMLGATAGGALYDTLGYQATFAGSAVMLIGSALVTIAAGRADAAANAGEPRTSSSAG